MVIFVELINIYIEIIRLIEFIHRSVLVVLVQFEKSNWM